MAANASQCLEEGAGQWPPRPPGPYSEARRLALEELVAGGPEALRAFLRRERLPPFLSEPEVQAIARSAVPPAAAEEAAAEASLDASSLTYFPERSDAEPPALELGWPGFGSGAFRGLTRVEAHFQPGGGDSPYGCKEAVRRQIRSARQVGAPWDRCPGSSRCRTGSWLCEPGSLVGASSRLAFLVSFLVRRTLRAEVAPCPDSPRFPIGPKRSGST